MSLDRDHRTTLLTRVLKGVFAGCLSHEQRIDFRRLLGTSERRAREKVNYSRHLRSSAYRGDTVPSEDDFRVLLALCVVPYLILVRIKGKG